MPKLIKRPGNKEKMSKHKLFERAVHLSATIFILGIIALGFYVMSVFGTAEPKQAKQSENGTFAAAVFALASDSSPACYIQLTLNEVKNSSNQVIFSLVKATPVYGSYAHLALPTFISTEHQYKWEIASVGSYGFNSNRFVIFDSKTIGIREFASSVDTLYVPMVPGISYSGTYFTVTDIASGKISGMNLPPGMKCI